MPVLARQVHDDELVEAVGITHEDEATGGVAHGGSADVEDAARPGQAANEDAAPVVEGRTELRHRRGVAPLRGVDQPLDQLARAERAALQFLDVRAVVAEVGLPPEEEVEDPA